MTKFTTIHKIKSQKNLVALVAEMKKQGKQIVTFNGSFDILHSGHVKSLEEAKSQGDILIVLVNSDKSIKSYKSSKRPIVPQKERLRMLSALECVDYLTTFNEINSKKILSRIKPNIHCNGRDWGKNCVERATVETGGGRVYVLQWTQGLSTSKLIKKIIDAYRNPVKKAIFVSPQFSKKKLSGDYLTLRLKEISVKKIVAELNRAVSDFDISLNDSWIISENINAIMAGREVNAKTLKIGSKIPKTLKIEPNFYAENLKIALSLLKKND